MRASSLSTLKFSADLAGTIGPTPQGQTKAIRVTLFIITYHWRAEMASLLLQNESNAHKCDWKRQGGYLYTVHVSGAHLCLSEMGRCQQRHCFLLLTGLDHCSYENCALPGFPRPALISLSLTHVHLRVSDMRIMLRTYGAVAFDPEKAKTGAPAPTRRMLHAHRRKEVSKNLYRR